MIDREDHLQGVEQIVALLRDHPEVPLPNDWTDRSSGGITIWAGDKDIIARTVRAMGGGEKGYGNSWFAVGKKFGPVRLQVLSNRSTVCRRVVTGTKVIPARPEMVVEDVEWMCDESVFAAEGGAGSIIRYNPDEGKPVAGEEGGE